MKKSQWKRLAKRTRGRFQELNEENARLRERCGELRRALQDVDVQFRGRAAELAMVCGEAHVEQADVFLRVERETAKRLAVAERVLTPVLHPGTPPVRAVPSILEPRELCGFPVHVFDRGKDRG